jgi:ubiquinone/menaquinone biosynthesis C-methylase UbiE
MSEARPICDYEGSNYQAEFWDKGERDYEDRAERIALNAFLPKSGRLCLEVGAGAGRLTPLLAGRFDRVVLMDYSRTQMAQARTRLGDGEDRYTFVAANVYQLPFAPNVFDGATMIRVIHHLADAPAALKEIRSVMAGGVFILEFANKQNWKAIARYLLGRQTWSPFTPEPVEFVKLNFDFHPRTMRGWLEEAGFAVKATRTVSHYRLPLLKRLIPANILAAADGVFQPTGEWMQFSPSVFLKCEVAGRGKQKQIRKIEEIFICPNCKSQLSRSGEVMDCFCCGKRWGIKDEIYDFKEPL